jgi:tetratricopeptide (TPR) repeat protein
MIWGMGGGGQLVLPPEFNEAIGLLYRNRVPVVTVGTGAGQLTAGIALTARATGGIHTSARANFPEQMLTRIEGFVAGSYELVLRTDTPLASGEYLISVRTKDPRLHVRAAPAIVIDAVDMRYADAVAMLNAGAVDEGVQLLRESMASAGLPREVLVERLSAFVDAAQWEAALAVVERLEAAGAIDDEVAQLRDEVKRGAAARTRMSAQTLLTAARKALLAGDDRKGLALLEQALAVDPGLAEPWFERGMLLLALGKTEDARASLERCLALDPHGVNAATAREVIAGLGE